MFKIEVIDYQNTILCPYEDIFDIPYYEIIKVEATVKISINNDIFLEEMYFPILELIYQFYEWKNNEKKNNFKNSFEYHSIESTENPIISFCVKNGKCYFDSVWDSSLKSRSAELIEVLKGMDNCTECVLKELKRQTNY